MCSLLTYHNLFLCCMLRTLLLSQNRPVIQMYLALKTPKCKALGNRLNEQGLQSLATLLAHWLQVDVIS